MANKSIFKAKLLCTMRGMSECGNGSLLDELWGGVNVHLSPEGDSGISVVFAEGSTEGRLKSQGDKNEEKKTSRW